LDTWKWMARGMGYAALILALAGGAFWLGTHATAGPSPAWADTGSPTVTDQAAQIGGQPVGEVLVDGTVVIRMRTASGGFTAHERATIIADRVRRWVSGPFSPYDLAVREGAYGDAELRAAGQLLVTANTEEAAALDSTAIGLAQAWRDNIMMALGAAPELPAGGTGAVPGEGAAQSGTWTPSEPYSDKIVPIISVLEGVKIGAARINGPESKVSQVQGVAQLETHFKDYLEIDVYVPITTDRPGPGGLDRVQEVGVTALGDLEIDL